MARLWMHILFDIITHGQYISSYREYHKWKDEPSQRLGIEHRVERHDDCRRIIEKLKKDGILLNVKNQNEFLKSLSQLNNLKLEELEAIGIVHEVLDYVWSGLSKDLKMNWAVTFKDMIMDPTGYFKNGLLDPKDLELEDFKKIRTFVEANNIEDLI